MSGHGGHIDASSKRVALVIAVLAAALAISETLGKSAQTAALSYNVEASNLWSFFQAMWSTLPLCLSLTSEPLGKRAPTWMIGSLPS